MTEEMPPCFLWHTLEDKTVSAENGYLFAEACRKAGVPYAHHVFCGEGHMGCLSPQKNGLNKN